MKTNYAFLFSILFVIGCNKTHEEEIDSIIGEWKLTETYDGGSVIPSQNIENGHSIKFNEDYSVNATNIDCTGSYSIEGSTLTLVFPCKTPSETNYNFNLTNNRLSLSITPSTCDEGCYDSYKKIY